MKKLSLCVLIFSLLMLASSCKEKSSKTNIKPYSSYSSFNGTHDIYAKKTSDFIISNNKSKYVILLPDSYSKSLYQGAAELKLILNLAGGANLSIKKESSYVSGPYISLGNTLLFKKNVKASTDNLKDNGYLIKNVNKNIFIYGNKDCAIINGVYGFLEQVVNFSTYAFDEIVYKSGDVSFYELDIVDIPDIEYRVLDVSNKIDGDPFYRMRLKLNSNDDVFGYVNGTLYHNSLYYFPKDEYSDPYYDDWYSESNGSTDYLQLCYAAHGNKEKLNEMIDIASDLIIKTLLNTKATNVTFMQADNNNWCQCDYCVSMRKKYGTDAAVMIHFLNLLSEEVEEKLIAQGHLDQKFNICFFAYQKTEKAPVIKNADGSYSAIDSTVKLNPHVSVYYAPIYADYTTSFIEGDNKVYADTLEAWKAICNQTFVWFYQTNFSHYLYPYNSLPTMQERYNFIAKEGAEFIFDQSQWDQETKTAFHRLKSWMSAKLSWNVNLNYTDLLDEYFENYFKNANKPMRKLFDEVSLHMEYLANYTDMDGNIYFQINQHKYFSKPLLDNWLNYIEEAYEAILPLKEEDLVLYNKIYERIAIEALCFRYMQIDMYAGFYSEKKLREMQIDFMQDCFKYGVDKIAEIKDISTIFTQWGII